MPAAKIFCLVALLACGWSSATLFQQQIEVPWHASRGAYTTAATGEPGWHVGWVSLLPRPPPIALTDLHDHQGFEKAGGFPAMPKSMQTYDMQLSTGAYFVGNDTGLNNAAENQAEAKLGVAGLGWQLGMTCGGDRLTVGCQPHLEANEITVAKQLKAINPKMKVLVSRNSEVATIVWDSATKVMNDPKYSAYWVHDPTGKISNGSWVTPKGSIPYGKLFFNFSNPDFVEWWLDTHLGDALNEPNIDGEYSAV